MSVYIKGMEMPKTGRYEAVIVVLDNSTAEIAISPAEDDTGYWKEYPLAPVPEHGRLIDGYALMERFSYSPGDTAEDRIWIRAARRIIIEAPTIIPASKVVEG